MKDCWAILLGLGLMFVSIGAPAEIVQSGLRGPVMSYEEIRMRCLHPRDFDKSGAPQNVVIACQSIEHRWTDLGHFYGDVRASESIESEVSFSFGHTVNAPWQIQGAAPFMCSKYKPVREVKTLILKSSCEDLLQIEDSIELGRYCMNQLKAGKASDPGFSITQEPEGAELEPCL